MRVLFTQQPGYGHFHPLVPIAQALKDAGHEVAFATMPHFCKVIAASGFQSFPVGVDETPEELEERARQQAVLPGWERAVFMWTRVFAGSRPERTLPDTLAVCKEWQPDVIVRDLTEFAGCVAAECLGIPHATVHLAAFRPSLLKTVQPQIDRLRESVGLPPDPDLDSLFRYLVLSMFPPSYQDPAVPLPPTTHAVRHDSFSGSSADATALPEWVRDLPEQPVVYATLGTVMNRELDVLRAILTGLAEEPVSVILTTGPGVEPEDLGKQPAHTYVERYVPQSAVLPLCDLVITHGGSGTVKDALNLGLPMVVIPIAADQHINAARCAALEVALAIPPDGRTPVAIRDATREVLRNPLYRKNAEHLRDEMHALPGQEHAVELLERLAVEKAPLLNPAAAGGAGDWRSDSIPRL